MERKTRGRTMLFLMCLLFSLSGILRVGATVRGVDFLQIFASGALFGVGLTGLIRMLRARSQPAT